eukprot:2612922-Pleurochrysis_carterae.AAC.1
MLGTDDDGNLFSLDCSLDKCLRSGGRFRIGRTTSSRTCWACRCASGGCACDPPWRPVTSRQRCVWPGMHAPAWVHRSRCVREPPALREHRVWQ